MSEEDIYKRINANDVEIGRFDERLITVEKNHEDFKKGLWAVENSVNDVKLKIEGLSVRMMVFTTVAVLIGGSLVQYVFKLIK